MIEKLLKHELKFFLIVAALYALITAWCGV